MTANNEACERFLDDLAAVADGDPDVLALHLDHLEQCDACRDARHEATTVLAAVAAAGDDFVAPADLEARVLAHVDAQAATSSATAEAPTGAASAEPEAVTVREARAPNGAAGPADARAHRRGRRAWLMAGGLVAAAAASVVIVARDDGEDWTRPPTGASASWTGKVAVVDRAAADKRPGIEVRLDGAREFAPAGPGVMLPAGAALRTDDSTRIELALSDGTRVYLDHATEVALGRGGRELVLARGNLVADVAHLDRAPNAVFRAPTGRVEVLGTRFSLSATDDHASVRVVRGAVRLVSDRGQVDVRPGEEGTAGRVGPPEVAAAGDVVAAVGWSELLAAGEPSDELPAGIGELRALKPGEKRDRDWKLALSRHRVTVRIAGNVARTEIEETFQNDSPTALEGVYRFPLPPDARIERLALDVNGAMEEGAFVAKDRAARIWKGVIQKAAPRKIAPRDEIIWVPGPWRDPALLEWQQGGRFELRIFPIPARGARTIQLAYTQILEPQGAGSERRYVYPLPHHDGASAARVFDIDVRLSGADASREPRVASYPVEQRREGDAHRFTMHANDFRPRGDFAVEYALPDSAAELRAWSFAGAAAAAPTVAASRRGGGDPAVVAAQREIAADARPTALVALRPRLPRWTESRARDIVLVVDSSQSMVGERSARARKLVTALVGEMDRRDRFALLACDVDCRAFAPEAQPPSAAAAKRVGEWLGQVQPAGASDLIGALERAARLRGAREAWIIYIGDGAATTGYRRLSDLKAEAAALAGRERVSISTVGIGGDADTSALATVARAGHGFFTPYAPGQRAELAALSVLETTFGVALVDPVVELPPGLEDVSPAELPTLRAGQELLVAARMTGPVRGHVVLRGTVGGKPYRNRFPIALEPSAARGNAFVPRVWAALTIERMELDGADQARIVAMSQAYGVLSRHTSLLVLESPAMFRAFGVDRSRPALEWSGDEAAEAVESTGEVRHDATTRRPRLASSGYGRGAGGMAGAADKGADVVGGIAAAGEAAAEDESLDVKAKNIEAREQPNKAPVVQAPMQRARRMIPMRREWFRTGEVGAFDRLSSRMLDAVARADSAHRLEPDSRERHRALVQALAYAGDLERAFQSASRWLERDRMDPEALVYMADLLGRQGRRADAVRLLSGVVDLEPDRRDLHLRLAEAYDRIGADDRACSHRVALAALAPADAATLGGALRCQRLTGRGESADRMLRGIADAGLRARVETTSALPPSGERAAGDLIVDASWEAPVDLDVSLVAPDGKRISWLGGRTGVAVERAGEAGRERLGLRRLRAGNYLVEVARSDPSDRSPVRGQLAIRALRARGSLPFLLTGDRAVVGRVTVTRESRLVPLGPTPF